MPRCLMAKKWKAYPWPERPDEETLDAVRTVEAESEEEIDVVGDSPAVGNAVDACWGPSSPTAGATAPSPPPHSPSGTTILYNGKYFQHPFHYNVNNTAIVRIYNTRSVCIVSVLTLTYI